MPFWVATFVCNVTKEIRKAKRVLYIFWGFPRGQKEAKLASGSLGDKLSRKKEDREPKKACSVVELKPFSTYRMEFFHQPVWDIMNSCFLYFAGGIIKYITYAN